MIARFIGIITGWTNKQHVRTSDLQIHLRSFVSVFWMKSPVVNKDERSDTLDWSHLLNIFTVRSAPDDLLTH